jgi:salicylate hydroxylase
VILARRLADSGTIPQALAAFDAERQPRAGKMARMETKNRDAKTAGPIAARMREVIMPHVFNRFYEGATGWLYDFDLATARDTKSSSDVCP